MEDEGTADDNEPDDEDDEDDDDDAESSSDQEEEGADSARPVRVLIGLNGDEYDEERSND